MFSRGLIKSMLRKNPELRPSVCVVLLFHSDLHSYLRSNTVPLKLYQTVGHFCVIFCFTFLFTSKHTFSLSQAADLLAHPLLQPCVLKIHLKLENPRYNSLPATWSESNQTRRTRFQEPEDSSCTDRDKRRSLSNNRILNPSIYGADHDSQCSTQIMQEFCGYVNQRLEGLSVNSSHEVIGVDKVITGKTSNSVRTPRMTPSKASATPRRRTEPSKKAPNHEYVSRSK